MHLVVRGLDRAVSFYRDRLGLTVLGVPDSTVRLGAGDREIVVLHGEPVAPEAGRSTGLYHLAILLPSRAALAMALRHLVFTQTALHGASDHLVSEAIYLADPEGNGIELYRDRPRAEWPRDGDGIAMATERLDLQALFDEGAAAGDEASWKMPAGTRMGHVHLRVSDTGAAERFYREVLGFDLMARYGRAASVVAAGGYHHHIGMNTWESAGAPRPPDGSAGLEYFEIWTPDDAAEQRLLAAGVPVERRPLGVFARDPAGNGFLLRRPA